MMRRTAGLRRFEMKKANYMNSIVDNRQTADIRKVAVDVLRPLDWQSDANRKIAKEAAPELGQLLDRIVSLDARRDCLDIFAATQDLAYGAPGIAHAILPTVQAALIIQRCGSNEQQSRLLPLLRGRRDNAACVLLLESQGRGPSEWETVAKESEGTWRVNGCKVGVNDNGGMVCIVGAKTASGKIELFAMAERPPGLRPDRQSPVPTMALGASALAVMHVDNISLPEHTRLVAGVESVSGAIALSRLLLGSIAIGAASASLEYAQEWVKKRTAFGKPLAAFEAVAFDIADVDTRLQAAHMSLHQAAHDVSEMTDIWAIDDRVARTLARVTTVCASAAIDGVQLMGVHGIIHEHPQEHFHRIASSLSVLDADPSRSTFQLI